jgi:hypothetical protein
MTPQTATAQKFDVALGYRAGRIEIRLTDYSDNLRASGRPLGAVVRMPDGSRSDAILAEGAPGELSGSLEAAKPGTYYIQIKPPSGSDESFPPLAYTVSPTIDAEAPRPAPNYGLLERLASATGGRLNPAPDELATSRPHFEQTASFSPWLIVTAMILLIVEALIRRLTF